MGRASAIRCRGRASALLLMGVVLVTAMGTAGTWLYFRNADADATNIVERVLGGEPLATVEIEPGLEPSYEKLVHSSNRSVRLTYSVPPLGRYEFVGEASGRPVAKLVLFREGATLRLWVVATDGG